LIKFVENYTYKDVDVNSDGIPEGGSIEFQGNKDYGVYSGANKIPKEMVEEVIQDINFPLDAVGCNVIIAPFKLMMFDEDKVNGWSGSSYQGRAYATHVIYGARSKNPTKDDIGELIVHELGHMLMYNYYDCTYETHTNYIQQYMDLRGISDWDKSPVSWFARPAEIWAEDFRYLFGTDYMHTESFDTMYRQIGSPGEEIKQFFLNIADEIKQRNPQEETMNVDFSVPGRYTMVVGHMKSIISETRTKLNCPNPWGPGIKLGVMGTTGLSTAEHVHIGVFKGLWYELPRLSHIDNLQYSSKSQLDWFVKNSNGSMDNELLGGDLKITTEYDCPDYFKKYGWHHLGYDVSRMDGTKNPYIFWNRTFNGRVLKSGWDNFYGNYALIGYDTLQF